MTKIFESTIEEFVIELLQNQGWQYLAPEEQETERPDLSEVVLKKRLKQAIDAINPDISEEAKEQALRLVLNLPSQNLIDNNEAFHRMLTEGIEVELMGTEGIKGDKVHLIDFAKPENNEFLVCNQFTVIENNINKRPDVVLFVNGLPLVVIELKNPTDENATVKKAFTQLQNYKNAIPSLFYYNATLIASDGLDARAGTVSSDYSRFLAWKTS
ncbi:DEAD/DEAH box helicase, partial [Patescibacteria group bacterium]|nr:DEAD/DEAH box helicase [Patescibacteria group bacterium]